MTAPEPTANDDGPSRASRVGQVVEDCLSRRAVGERISDDEVLATHPELLPELAHELRKLALIERARERVERAVELSHGGSSERVADLAGDPLPAHLPGYEIIGEVHRGGQGIVYQAIQKSTKRKVALKVMREGPFSDARGRARFEREVQILAQLDHPGIVAIHDSGTAADHFYYVMDYIAGEPLDVYVAARRLPAATAADTGARLSLDDVLRLFVKICDAVNAAHLRGVIHRDLKPSNIRVDTAGEPHVLDFGLAKLVTGEVTDEPQPQLLSTTGQFIGSLPWASPEQAAGDPAQIDVRTDVYALGVVFYQTLTGEFPYPVTGNMRNVLDNILRVEPVQPRTVCPQLDDEVETIILRCLQKERARRYQTAGELARDLRHYRAGEPIEAKRDSEWYVLRKMLRRYRVSVAVAAAFVLVSAGALIVSTVFWQRAVAERDRALHAGHRAALVAKSLEQTLTSIDPDVARGASIAALREVLDAAARRVADELAEEPEVAAAVRDALGRAYADLGLLNEAAQHVGAALETPRLTLGDEHPDVAASLNNMAEVLLQQSAYADAEDLAREALSLRRRLYGDRHLAVAETLTLLGRICNERGGTAEAERLYGEALALRRELLGPQHVAVAEVLNHLAELYRGTGDLGRAEPLYRETWTMRRELLGEEHTEVAATMSNLGSLLVDKGEFHEAEELLRRALTLRRHLLGNEHPATLHSVNKLGLLLSETGNYAEAQRLFQEALDVRRRLLGEDHNDFVVSLNNLAMLLHMQGDAAAAEPLFREALAAWLHTHGPEHRHVAAARHNLAWTLYEQGRLAESEQQCRQALAVNRAVLGEDHWETGKTLYLLGVILNDTGRAAEAEPVLRESLRIHEAKRCAGDWRTARTRSVLGAALVTLKRYAEGEPLLCESYELLANAPDVANVDKRAALQRVIDLYEAWGQPDRAAAYRALLARPLDSQPAETPKRGEGPS
ncbi:MAG: serine/threonine-protein kinase [Planctomycetes bacterium]|nr:serine/threonine-protein kinase [Planctomycetota bacterium]